MAASQRAGVPTRVARKVARALAYAASGNFTSAEPAQAQCSVELRFGSNLSERDVVGIIEGMAVASRRQILVLDTEVDDEGLRHFLHGSKATIELITSRLRGIAPDVRIRVLAGSIAFKPSAGARLVTSHRHVLLKEQNEVVGSAVLLGALTEPLLNGERLLVRIVLRAAAQPMLPADQSKPFLRRNRVADRHRSRLQAKYDGPLVESEVLVFATANGQARARMLIARVTRALKSAQGTAGRIGAKPEFSGTTDPKNVRSFQRGQVLSPSEATALIGWPVGAPSLSGLHLGAAPSLVAPRGLPRTGRRFATSNARESPDRPIVQPIEGALQHSLIVGPTGSGKSTLVANLICEDVRRDRGAFVLDAKGDLIHDVLERIPRERHRDVILIDPSSPQPQAGLRLFSNGEDVELSVDMVLGTLAEIYQDEWKVRSRQYFRLGLITLATRSNSTMLDLPRLFHDRGFRAEVLAGVRDPHIHAAWQRFDSLSAAEQLQHLASPMTKLEELLGRRSIRAILGQATPKLHFGEVLARGRLVLVRVSPGQVGAPAARLIAGLTMWQFFSAVEARSSLRPASRPPFMAYIDEVSALGSMPLPIEGILERARGLGVGLTMSPQALSQLSKSVQSAALANAGTFVTFRQTGAQEASVAASALPGLAGDQIMNLDRFEVAMRMSLGPGDVTPTMTGSTLKLCDPIASSDEVRRIASANWGGDHEVSPVALRPELPSEPQSNRRKRAE